MLGPGPILLTSAGFWSSRSLTPLHIAQPGASPDVHFGAALQQEINHAQFGVFRHEIGQVDGVDQRVKAVLVIARVDIRAMRQQQIDDVLAPVHHRHVQRFGIRSP